MERVFASAKVDPQTSHRMSQVKSRNTEPEMAVRRALHRSGYRFRLHRSDLPGSPDIVLPRFGAAVFVHGCFWHGHNCKRGRLPATNVLYWKRKITRNQERDCLALEALTKSGWRVRVIWTCSIDSGIDDTLAFLDSMATQ